MPILPGPTSDTPPADDSQLQPDAQLGDPTASAGSPLTLSKGQLAAAGLDELAEDDTFTVTLTAKVASMDDNGVEAEVIDAGQGEVHSDEPGGSADEEAFQKPKSKIEMGPGNMKGFGGKL